MDSNTGAASSTSDQSRLTVPSINIQLAVPESGELTRTSTSTTQSDGSPCPSLIAKSESSSSSDNVTENDTPPESPGKSDPNVRSGPSVCSQEDTMCSQAAGLSLGESDGVTSQQSKAIDTGDSSVSSPRASKFMRRVSGIFTDLRASSSRLIKRKTHPPTLEIPPRDQSGPFTTSPQGPGYRSLAPCSQIVGKTLSNITEVSREGSQQSQQSPPERPDGLPYAVSARRITFTVTPPALEQLLVAIYGQTQGHMSPPPAPRLGPRRTPDAIMREQGLDGNISPCNLTSPVHLYNGTVVGQHVTKKRIVNADGSYFPAFS